jgi:hypothetical protein
MGRHALTVGDYEKRADELELELLDIVPAYTHTPVSWRCLRCGRLFRRPLSEFTRRQPCMCRTRKVCTSPDYERLALQLGIHWAGVVPPVKTNQETLWVTPDGRLFYASYKSLAYTPHPRRVRPFLEPVEPTESAVGIDTDADRDPDPGTTTNSDSE